MAVAIPNPMPLVDPVIRAVFPVSWVLGRILWCGCENDGVKGKTAAGCGQGDLFLGQPGFP
jgi:hypothetical protein